MKKPLVPSTMLPPPAERLANMCRSDRVAEDGSDGPVRTCVGCRSRAAKAELVRLVAQNRMVMPDVRGVLPGRGAHLHRDRRCLELAERRRVWPRAFRVPNGKDTFGWDASRVGALLAEEST